MNNDSGVTKGPEVHFEPDSKLFNAAIIHQAVVDHADAFRPMPKFLLGLLAALLISNAAQADTSNLFRKQSPYSAEETLNRLEAIVLSKGATVFARIDHAAGAMKADAKLRPTAVLIFGNPKIGTPIMLKSQEAGLRR